MAWRMRSLWAPEVGSSTIPAAPAYTTMATRSWGRICSTRSRMERWTRGSLSGEDMEPDTSSRKTRLAGGMSSVSTGRLARPTRRRRCSGAQGARPTSVVTPTGWRPSGIS